MALRTSALMVGIGIGFGITSAALGRGPDWEEPRNADAGKTPATATVPEGEGDLNSISGRLNGFFLGEADYQDMFAIFIDDPLNFSAHTSLPPKAPGFDTQLWIFDRAGRGLLANDDQAVGSLFSGLRRISDDGTVEITERGLYYIAISGLGAAPFSGDGLPIFDLATRIEVSGPDGPGGELPITDWFDPGDIGEYRINMTGVRFVPGPGSAAVMVLLMAVGARRRR